MGIVKEGDEVEVEKDDKKEYGGPFAVASLKSSKSLKSVSGTVNRTAKT